MNVCFYESYVSAGFPVPAEDYIDQGVDLNWELANRYGNCFVTRAPDDSMEKFSIFEGDLLIVQKDLHNIDNKIVLAEYQGTTYVRHLKKMPDGRVRISRGEGGRILNADAENDLKILGVIKHNIHSL